MPMLKKNSSKQTETSESEAEKGLLQGYARGQVAHTLKAQSPLRV